LFPPSCAGMTAVIGASFAGNPLSSIAVVIHRAGRRGT
jgi:hypothetical protein